jgi:hypothetical protein
MNCLQLQLEDKRSKFRRALAKYLLIISLLTYCEISAKAFGIFPYFPQAKACGYS